VRLDDQFADHPKVTTAGPLCGWLYVCGLLYAARYLTDGFIPTAHVARLAALPRPRQLAERLVQGGLWEHAEGGYRIHDYLVYNPTAAQVRRERDAAAERARRTRAGEVPANNGRSSGEVPPIRARVTSHVRTHVPPEYEDEGRPRPGDVARARASGAAAPTLPTIDDDDGRSLSDAMDPATIDAARAVWQPVSERLRGEMHARNWGLYIAPCVALGIAADGALLLSTANPLLLEQAPQFRQQMLRALADIPDAPRDVRLVAGP
jgi:hypothetical protein